MQGWCILSDQFDILFADSQFQENFSIGDMNHLDMASASPWLAEFVEVVVDQYQTMSSFKWLLGDQPYDISVSHLQGHPQSLILVQMTKWSSPLTQHFSRDAEEDANIGCWSIDFVDESVQWSPQVYKIYGVPLDSPVSYGFGISNYSKSAQKALDQHINQARLGTAFSEELDFYDANNQYKRVLVNGRPVFDLNNEAIGLKGTLQDISEAYFERRRNELAVDVCGLGVWELQQTGKLIWNNQMARLYEYEDTQNLTFANWANALHKDDRADSEAHFLQSMENRTLYQSEFRIIGKKTGETKYIRALGRHFFNKNGELERTVGVNLDITLEHRNKHEELIEKARDMQKSKFIALGELAAGIGHEINNPLSILQGNAELLEHHLEVNGFDERAQTMLHNIKHCVDRIGNISGGLRRLVRDDTLESYQIINLQAVLDSTVALLKEIYAKEGIQLSLKSEDDTHVLGHFSELQQVFLNLLTNARDALASSENKKINIELTNNENEVIVKVIDNGKGVPPELRPVIFDSLYTEKPSGKGTGLGLGLCKRIVTEHSGEISVSDGLDHGACFTVTLPLLEDESGRSDSYHAVDELLEFDVLPDQSIVEPTIFRIVVIDDEPLILQIVDAYLTNNGYECLCTSDVRKALSAIKTGMYHLVITDLCMPDISGAQLLDELQSFGINLPIIVMTGGVMMRDMERRHDDLVNGFLYKPFDEHTLIQEVDKCRKIQQTLAH